jgi:hypothetical protein
MYNNLTFISNPTNGILLLINLTLWTFSVGSYEEGVGVDGVFEGSPSDGVWGYPPARDAISLCAPAMDAA